MRKVAPLIAYAFVWIIAGLTPDAHCGQNLRIAQNQGSKQTAAPDAAYVNPRRERIGFTVKADLATGLQDYTGPCPVSVRFEGRVETNRATTVEYKFVRNDDVQTAPAKLVFDKPGVQDVSYTWELGQAGTGATLNGSIFMEVVYPINLMVKSNIVSVKVVCLPVGSKVRESVPGQMTGPTNHSPPMGPPGTPWDEKTGPGAIRSPLSPSDQNPPLPGAIPQASQGSRGPVPGMPMIPPDPKALPPGMVPHDLSGDKPVPMKLPTPQ